MTVNYPEEVGKHNGLFFGTFAVNTIVGNIIGGCLFFVSSEGGSEVYVLYGLLALAIIATIMFCFVRLKLQQRKCDLPFSPVPESSLSHAVPVKEKLLETIRAFKERDLMVWMPTMINFGVQCVKISN